MDFVGIRATLNQQLSGFNVENSASSRSYPIKGHADQKDLFQRYPCAGESGDLRVAQRRRCALYFT